VCSSDLKHRGRGQRPLTESTLQPPRWSSQSTPSLSFNVTQYLSVSTSRRHVECVECQATLLRGMQGQSVGWAGGRPPPCTTRRRVDPAPVADMRRTPPGEWLDVSRCSACHPAVVPAARLLAAAPQAAVLSRAVAAQARLAAPQAWHPAHMYTGEVGA
jgi:hypothetical protein